MNGINKEKSKGVLKSFSEISYSSLAKYVVAGAVGFGLGKSLWAYLVILLNSSPFVTSPFGELVYSLLGGFLFGAIGGLFLAILHKESKLRLIICSAIGYAITWLLLYYSPIVVYTVFAPFAIAIYGSRILIAGFLIGLAVKKIKLFILFGALGYLIGRLASLTLALVFGRGPSNLEFITVFMVEGLIIGLFLGIGMYFAEKSKISK